MCSFDSVNIYEQLPYDRPVLGVRVGAVCVQMLSLKEGSRLRGKMLEKVLDSEARG